jgi:hypothetical protein
LVALVAVEMVAVLLIQELGHPQKQVHQILVAEVAVEAVTVDQQTRVPLAVRVL